jgi:hypothetical protein
VLCHPQEKAAKLRLIKEAAFKSKATSLFDSLNSKALNISNDESLAVLKFLRQSLDSDTPLGVILALAGSKRAATPTLCSLPKDGSY